MRAPAAVFITVAALVSAGCSSKAPPPKPAKVVEKVPEPAPRVVPLIPKMKGINEQMERLVQAVKAEQQEQATEAANLINNLALAIHVEHDLQPGYGDQFAAITADFQAASKAMIEATKGSPQDLKIALRHLHDQCLRCHDQAPAAAGAGVCQLAD